MQTPSLRSARDYNRGLPAPIRWAHSAFVSTPLKSLIRWAAARRSWAPPLLIALPLILIVLPFDGMIARFAGSH